MMTLAPAAPEPNPRSYRNGARAHFPQVKHGRRSPVVFSLASCAADLEGRDGTAQTLAARPAEPGEIGIAPRESAPRESAARTYQSFAFLEPFASPRLPGGEDTTKPAGQSAGTRGLRASQREAGIKVPSRSKQNNENK